MPKTSPAPPCLAVDQWIASPPSATCTPPWPSSFNVLSAIALIAFASASPAALRELDLGEGDPAVLRDRRALGERIADGETSDDLLISARTRSISVRWSSTLPDLTAKTTLAVSPDCCGNRSFSRS